jgi:hypothetical protein
LKHGKITMLDWKSEFLMGKTTIVDSNIQIVVPKTVILWFETTSPLPPWPSTKDTTATTAW